MLRYLLNYFVARTTYDVVRGHAVRRAQHQAAVNYQNALTRAELEARANYVPTIDDNMVNTGAHHAKLGTAQQAVALCYGAPLAEHERKDVAGSGIKGTVYRIGIFDVGVEFQNDRSVRECWIKNIRAPSENITGGEMLAIMAHKSYGPGWTQLSNSSDTRLWYRSEDGLIACCDWNSPIAGGCALTVFDPSAGTPEGLPQLPPPIPALRGPVAGGRKQTNGCLIALAVVVGLPIVLSIFGAFLSALSSSIKQAPSASTEPTVAPTPSNAQFTSATPSIVVRRAEMVSPAPTKERTPASESQEAKITYAPPPIYPAWAKRMNLRASGQFRIHFGRDGRALNVQVARSTGDRALDQVALTALLRWRAQTVGQDWTTVVPISFAPTAR